MCGWMLDVRSRTGGTCKSSIVCVSVRCWRLTYRWIFAYSQEEPLAWLPDIVAGAVSAAIGDGDHQYLMPLASVMFDMITIEL
jgi:hypothetical protein